MMRLKSSHQTEEFVEKGEALYEKPFANGKSFKDCFPEPSVAGFYVPIF